MTLVQLPVFTEPGLRHMHPTLVTPWQRFRSLLQYGHLWLPVSKHEKLPQPSQVFGPGRLSLNQALHQIYNPREQHPVDLQCSSPEVHSCNLWQCSNTLPLHMMSQVRGIHCPPTLLACYSSFPLFPKRGSLPCSSPIVRLNSMLPPNEPWSAYHRLGLTQVCLQADPLKHSYHGRQCCLHLDRILPCYTSVIYLKSYAVFSRRPSEPMLSLLGSTDLLEGRPDHCIHYDIKNRQGYRFSLCHSSLRSEGTSIILPLLWNHPLPVPIPLEEPM